MCHRAENPGRPSSGESPRPAGVGACLGPAAPVRKAPPPPTVSDSLGPSTFHVETPSKKADAPRQAGTLLSQFSPTFLVDASHACKERGKRNFTGVAPALRDTVEGMYEGVCNCFESTTLPLPNREVRPLESWQARMPLFVLTRGKRTIQDIFLTCTYEGVTAVNGRQEAYVSLAGEVKGRGPAAARPLGKARGYAHVDVEKGFLALVQLTVSSEVEVEESGVRVLVNEESTMRRKEGNLLGIVAATRNQPGAPPAPPIRRR